MEEFPGFDVDGGAFVQGGKEGGHQKSGFFILREDESSDKTFGSKASTTLVRTTAREKTEAGGKNFFMASKWPSAVSVRSYKRQRINCTIRTAHIVLPPDPAKCHRLTKEERRWRKAERRRARRLLSILFPPAPACVRHCIRRRP